MEKQQPTKTSKIQQQVLTFLNNVASDEFLISQMPQIESSKKTKGKQRSKQIISKALAENIVQRRDKIGRFTNVNELLEIKGITQKKLDEIIDVLSSLDIEITNHTFNGRLTDKETAEGLSGWKVEAMMVTGQEALGFDFSDAQGYFSFQYALLSNPQILNPELQLSIYSPSSEEAIIKNIIINPDETAIVSIPVEVPTPPIKTDIPIESVLKERSLPPQLQTYLNDNQIQSLRDIAQLGGLSSLEDLPIDKNSPIIQSIDAHARLNALPIDIATQDILIQKGFTHIGAIGKASQEEFVQSVDGVLEAKQAGQIHATAKATYLMLNHILTTDRIQQKKGTPINPSLPPIKCDCKDCELAVSPIAYYTDLLDYTLDHTKFGNNKITISQLENIFYQPFGQLPTSCASQDDKLCQKRIAIEVLCSYINTLPPSGFDQNIVTQGHQKYWIEAYQNLLQQMGTSYDEIRLIRCASREEQQQLANRLGITLQSGNPNELDELLLDIPSLSPEDGEKKLEELFGYRYTKRDPLDKTPEGKLSLWRKAYLRKIWEEEDWINDRFSEREIPVIDPDLIGVDDLQKPESGEPIFDLWEKRRKWIDKFATSARVVLGTQNFEAVLLRMYQLFSYSGGFQSIWENQTQPSDFNGLQTNLIQGIDQTNTELRIWNDLNMKPDAFIRLMEIRVNGISTKDDREDFFSILIQSYKNKFYGEWIQEEQSNNIYLNPFDFKNPIREPQVGFLPVVVFNNAPPFIDPELITLEALPEVPAGDKAILRWNQRNDFLVQQKIDFQTKHQNDGFEKLLELAWNQQAPFNPSTYLDDFITALDSTDQTIKDNAISEIESDLKLSVEDFKFIMDIRAKEISGTPTLDLDELSKVYDLLVTSKKLKLHYPQWRAQENSDGFTNNYWQTHKATLPKWRISNELRTEWNTALDQRIALSVALKLREENPIIDPDIIELVDLKEPTSGDAHDIWIARRAWVDNELDALRNLNPDLNQMILDTIGVDINGVGGIKEIADLEKNGENISSRLEKLLLTYSSFRTLLNFINLYEKNVNILSSEWEEIYQLLVQVKKVMNFWNWHLEEINKGITLSQDYFVLPENDLTFLPLDDENNLKWLYDGSIHRNWTRKLKARIEQEESVLSGIQIAIEKTEDATLSIFRNTIIESLRQTGESYDQTAQRLSDQLLIDLKENCCKQVTRLSQSIETIQLLLWSLRTKQLSDTYPELTSCKNETEFDEEWKWLGSYSTWRAAMFVFLYPENILYPTLRRNQSPAFRELVNDVRRNKRLTPQDACEAASNYYDYYIDISRLEIGATAHAMTRIQKSKKNNSTFNGEAYLFYKFAHSWKTKKIYWSASHPEGLEMSADYWTIIPELKGVKVEKIIGTSVYEINAEERYLYLFILIKEKGELVLNFIRYNLQSTSWTGEIIPLDLEDNFPDLRPSMVFVKQNYLKKKPPHLGFQKWINGKRNFYERKLNQQGLEWEEREDWVNNEWEPLISDLEGVLIESMIEHTSDTFYLVGQTSQSVFFRVTGRTSDTGWIKVGDSATFGFIGATYWEDNKDCYIFYKDINNVRIQAWIKDGSMQNNFIWGYQNIDFLYPTSGFNKDSSDNKKWFAYKEDNIWEDSRLFLLERKSNNWLTLIKAPLAIKPEFSSFYSIASITLSLEKIFSLIFIDYAKPPTSAEQHLKKMLIEHFYKFHRRQPESVRQYIWEAYYFVPIYLGLQLSQRGQYIAALDWYRIVYDYSNEINERKIFYGLIEEESQNLNFSRSLNWLQDPLNPHAIAINRKEAYSQFTIQSIVRCLLSYADTEYSLDTVESVPRAKTLYQTALELLNLLKPNSNQCQNILSSLSIELSDGFYKKVWNQLLEKIERIQSPNILQLTVDETKNIMAQDIPIGQRLNLVGQLLISNQEEENDVSIIEALEENEPVNQQWQSKLSVAPNVEPILINIQEKVIRLHDTTISQTQIPLQSANSSQPAAYQVAYPLYDSVFVPKPIYFNFCIPRNPIINALCLKAELNLFKIRNCMNIAGVERQLEPYAAPTDAITDLPTIGTGGQISLPGTSSIVPTPYRYNVLIDRAKQLASISQQMESAFLSALEKRDGEYYNLLKARQDLALSKSGIRLQTLRVKEAEGGVKLAELQKESTELRVKGLQEMIDAGLNSYENTLIAAYYTNALLNISLRRDQFTKDVIQTGGSNALSEGVNKTAVTIINTLQLLNVIRSEFFQAGINHLSLLASQERRLQEWNFQKSLGEQDIKIGSQQISLTKDRVRIVNQEKNIAEMQADFAQETLDFLRNKFTNFELYDWMSEVLEEVYANFLQQASAMAKLAENQLAFERQETPPAIIQSDYWETPVDNAIVGTVGGNEVDRRGLTGSARLLQDIYQLDQYAFDTNERKMQLTKTISLATLDPIQFQLLKEDGVMDFYLSREMFEWDFPGHYLRLIKKVRTSVIALIPPVEGIKATLINNGTSRVVIGGDIPQEISIPRTPESVALTNPRNATGLFELEPQGEFLNPFEGSGVNSSWQFRMEKAANLFNYDTIADVLITIEYTALQSFDYRRQVIQRLNFDKTITADRPFSFKNEFADQWYDLHHPDQTDTPMSVQFEVFESDFPSNLKGLTIAHITLYFARKDGATFEVNIDALKFLGKGTTSSIGGGAIAENGLVSTRSGNAGNWIKFAGKSMEGIWTLSLANDIVTRSYFDEEEIVDILFVVSYSGERVSWLK